MVLGRNVLTPRCTKEKYGSGRSKPHRRILSKDIHTEVSHLGVAGYLVSFQSNWYSLLARKSSRTIWLQFGSSSCAGLHIRGKLLASRQVFRKSIQRRYRSWGKYGSSLLVRPWGLSWAGIETQHTVSIWCYVASIFSNIQECRASRTKPRQAEGNSWPFERPRDKCEGKKEIAGVGLQAIRLAKRTLSHIQAIDTMWRTKLNTNQQCS